MNFAIKPFFVVFIACIIEKNMNDFLYPLMSLVSRSESLAWTQLPDRTLERVLHRLSSHEVLFPSALEVMSSDLRRAYLARLCGAFRFSQSLDALFRS
jgi:hypothetical protein